MLAMDIGQEMFGTFGQVQNGIEPDDFRTGSLNRGKLFGKQTQIMQLLRSKKRL